MPSLATHVPAIRPHVTLAVTDDADGLRAVAGGLRSLMRPVEVELVGPAFFPTAPPILFLSVGPTEQLLTLHRDAAEVLGSAGVDVWPHYRPGAWMPHCTLSMGVPDGRRGDAVDACIAAGLPIRMPLGEPMLTDSETGETTPL